MRPELRQRMIQLHVILAGFFLPMAATFAITGGLYTFGIKGDYDTIQLSPNLQLPSEPKLSEALTAAKVILEEQGIKSFPKGSPAIRKVGTSWQFEWTGITYDFTLEPTTEASVFKAAIKKTSPHRFFVQLHKAKGGLAFKILAGAWAIGLILLFVSGVLMAFAMPKLKRQLYLSAFLGFLAFAALAFIS